MMMFDVTERRLLDRLLDSSPAKSERLMMMMIMLDWDVAFVTAPNFLFFFIYFCYCSISICFFYGTTFPIKLFLFLVALSGS